MTALTIYMEGGGASKDQKALLRQGMSQFLVALKDKTSRQELEMEACSMRRSAGDL